MQSEIQRIKSTFDNNNIPVSLEWLEECIAWCKGEVLGSNYTIDQLKDAIHDQWLLLDLRDIESLVLPSGLSEKKYMLLNGNFSLQIMQVVDISKPKYWQIQQIRKENILSRPPKNEINDSVGSGKRVLQLTLTDGVQYVEAIEYKQIPVLDINLTPGIKVRLSGPITIRRGRLMLQEKNIRILGGEVESLLISNAAENILAKALNLPENPNPNIVDVNILTVELEDENTQNNTQQLKNSRDMYNSNELISRNIQNNKCNQISEMHSQAGHSFPNTSAPQEKDYPTEEDFEMLMEAENLLQKNEHKDTTTKHQTSAQNKNSFNKFLTYGDMKFDENENNNSMSKRNKTPDLFEDDFNPDQIDQLLEMTNKTEEKQPKNNFEKKSCIQLENNSLLKSSNTTKHSTTHNDLGLASNPTSNTPKHDLFDEFINEYDLFSGMDIDNHENTKLSENKCDIITITELLQHIQHIRGGCFKVHGKFKSIVEKLTLQEQEYKLTIMIQDESNEAICRVHTDVVSKWAGLNPAEIMNLKTNIFSQDVESKKKVEKALQNIKDMLIDINHVMEIEVIGKDMVPIIKNIIY